MSGPAKKAPKLAEAGVPARRAAMELLLGVFREGLSFSDQEARLAKLAPAERAAARRLAVETVRNLPGVDAMVGRFAKKKPPEPVRSALRLGVWEMAGEGAAAHGVVNALVSVLRKHPKGRHHAGMANAVLRQVGEVAAEGLPKVAPVVAEPLGGALIEDYGAEKAAAMAAVFAQRPPLDITLKGADAGDWAARLGAELLPTGSLRLAAGGGAVSGLTGFEAGDWWVQDAAAAVPALALGPVEGLAVLDLCAAPGGKTMQLAARGADVTAVDASAARMMRLEQNLARTKLKAKSVVADLMDWAPEGPVDAILLDAPCSATGTLRRHPELPHIRDGFDPSLLETQAALLERAAGWLKPGGKLVYATCSLLPEEGEAHLDAAGHFGLELAPFEVPGLDGATEGWMRLTPDIWAERGGMDGFFIAAFTKTG